MFINDVPRFLAIFDLPTYLVLLYNVPFLGLSWTPLPTLIRDVINGRSLAILITCQPRTEEKYLIRLVHVWFMPKRKPKMGGISELKFFFTELGFKLLARAMHQLSICNVD